MYCRILAGFCIVNICGVNINRKEVTHRIYDYMPLASFNFFFRRLYRARCWHKSFLHFANQLYRSLALRCGPLSSGFFPLLRVELFPIVHSCRRGGRSCILFSTAESHEVSSAICSRYLLNTIPHLLMIVCGGDYFHLAESIWLSLPIVSQLDRSGSLLGQKGFYPYV